MISWCQVKCWVQWYSFHDRSNLCLYSLRSKTPYRQISQSLEAERLDVLIIVSFSNVTGVSAAPLPRCMSNFRAIGIIYTQISRLGDFTRSRGKTSFRLRNRGPVLFSTLINPYKHNLLTICTQFSCVSFSVVIVSIPVDSTKIFILLYFPLLLHQRARSK